MPLGPAHLPDPDGLDELGDPDGLDLPGDPDGLDRLGDPDGLDRLGDPDGLDWDPEDADSCDEGAFSELLGASGGGGGGSNRGRGGGLDGIHGGGEHSSVQVGQTPTGPCRR